MAALPWDPGDVPAWRADSLTHLREVLGSPARSARAEEWGVHFLERPSEGQCQIALPPGIGIGSARTHGGRTVIELRPDWLAPGLGSFPARP